MKITLDIVKAGIYGIAIGDAIGVPFQFLSRSEVRHSPCTDMIGYGTYNKMPGTFSDDTSMTLATMEGIGNTNGGSLYVNIMNNFVEWLRYSKFTVDGTFDEGTTCSKAIYNYINGININDCGGSNYYDNGNGALMRILPASLYLINYLDNDQNINDYSFVENVSKLTHAHPISIIGCSIFTNIIFNIIKKQDVKNEFFRIVNETLSYYQNTNNDNYIEACKKYNRLIEKQFINLDESEIKSSGYVVDSLEASLYCFLKTDNFKDCMLKAVNLGDDTDTIASIAGGIAGIYYGFNDIPSSWIQKLRGSDLLDKAISSFNQSLSNLVN